MDKYVTPLRHAIAWGDKSDKKCELERSDALTGGMEVKACSMRGGANPSSINLAYTCKRRFWTTFLLPFESATGVGGGGVESEIDVCNIGRKNK